MRKNKFILGALILLLCLLCISAVSAADDADSSDIVADTIDETVLEESIDDAALSDSQSEENVLTEDPVQPKTFTDLNNLINNGESAIELESDYKYVEQDNLKDGISINRNLTINGNGHIIDADGQARSFHVIDNAVVTFNNISFLNGYAKGGYGAAIWAEDTATAKALNCIFINNSADLGGALYRYVNSENCIFIKNHAYQDGGAIYKGNATNCVFLSNKAEYMDDNVFSGVTENCSFPNSATISVSDFIAMPYSGEKQMVNLTADNGQILNNVPITVKIFKGDDLIGTYYALSGVGWIVDLPVGNYIAKFSLNSPDIEEQTRNIKIHSGTSFWDLDYIINKQYLENTTINLDTDYAYEDDDGEDLTNGIRIVRNLIINGNGHTIDGKDMARMFHVLDDSVVTFNNITFINAYTVYGGYGGAIWNDGEAKAINCLFNNNEATSGGAVSGVDCENCIFINNYANENGGAMYEGNASNCIFLSNDAFYNGKNTYNTETEKCIFAASATLDVSDFYSMPYSGEKQMINLTADNGQTLNNIPVTIRLTKDGEDAGTYSGLSGDGWIVNLASGNYTAKFSVDGAEVEEQTRNVKIASGTSFWDLDYIINKQYLENTTINLDTDYIYDDEEPLKDGIRIVHNVTINGNGHTIDGNGKARIFHILGNTVVTFNNISFINAHTAYGGNGGAILAETISTVKAINSTFNKNNASYGGAVYHVDCENCIFLNNYAQRGGAMYEGNANNCIFLSNSAEYTPSHDIYNTDNEYCIFVTSANLSVSDLFTVPYSGEKQMINLTTDNGQTLNNIPVTIRLTKDGEDAGTYSALSGVGWIVNLAPGNYTAKFSVDGADVEEQTRKIDITSGTSFYDLDYLINKKYLDNTTIYLDTDYAHVDGIGGGITINRDLTIYGNGHTINASDLTRIFFVTNKAVVTFDNITFANGFVPQYNGGALSANSGGALSANDGCTVKAIHCEFRENTAGLYGGAVSGVDCEDCYFAFNKATADDSRGGAIHNGNAVNCTFMGNEAVQNGGAIYIGNATDSQFVGNKAKTGGAICVGNAINCEFESNEASNSGGAIYDGNATGCTFIQNSANYGGAISTGQATNSTFSRNQAGIGGAIAYCDAVNSSFYKNSAREKGGAISEGNAENCNFTENTANDMGGAIFRGNAVNSNFTDNSGLFGGAIAVGNAKDSNFTGNDASNDGGAIYKGNAENCIFTNNHADKNGGAICIGNATDSYFTLNSANSHGGAIHGDTANDIYSSAVNCTFDKNVANTNGGAIAFGDATNCSFTGNDVSFGQGTAMFALDRLCQAVNCIFTDNNADKQVIKHGIADSCIFNGGDTPGDDVVIQNPVIHVFNFISTYNDGSILVVNVTSTSGMPIENADIKIKVDVYTTGGDFVGTYNISSNGWKVPLNAGNYKATYQTIDFDSDPIEGMIVVNKVNTTINSSAVSTVYNKNKYLVITLKDSKGNALSGAKVTVTLASVKTYTTDKNGQIKINIAKLVPKTYNVKISFAGNANYAASSKTVKATVKKAAAKMTAKKKTFKRKVKVKKYTITLKNNVKKAIKGVKVTLKVNKKTFKAKTNNKGKAVFKIKNLKKKGTYKATVKFAGNKYYKKVTKKVKIRVKK